MPIALHPELHTPLLLAAFGAVFFGTGCYVVYEQLTTPEPAWKHAQELTTDTPEGSLVFASGVLEAAARDGHGLALWQRQQAVADTVPGKSELRFSWQPIAAGPESVALHTELGVLELKLDAADWRDPPEVIGPEEGLTVAGSERWVGFRPGATLAVFGRLEVRTYPPRIAVEVLGPGDVASLRRSFQISAAVPWVFAVLFTVLGAGLILQLAWARWRLGRWTAPTS